MSLITTTLLAPAPDSVTVAPVVMTVKAPPPVLRARLVHGPATLSAPSTVSVMSAPGTG